VTVSIITDSAAALPPELVRERDIAVVPMWLTIEGEPVLESAISLHEVLTHDHVTTSGPTPGEFEAAVKEQQRTTDDGVLVLTIASTMSGTYESAVIGATAAGGPVGVIDTKTAAGAQALVVLAAADAAAGGASLAQVAGVARAAIGEVRLIAMVPSLDALVSSGRVPNLAGWAGRHLGLVPLFEFRSGRAHGLRPARGVDAALDRIVARYRRDRAVGARLHVAALHADAEERAQQLLGRVCAEVDPATAFVGTFGTVMAVHTGPGLVGLAWRWELPS